MSTINLTVPARQVVVGDFVVNAPGTDAYGVACTVENGGMGTVGLWTETKRGQWRPADAVLNHGDPVQIRRVVDVQTEGR